MVDIAQDHSAEDRSHDHDAGAVGAATGASPPQAATSTRRGFLAMAGGAVVTVAVGGAVAARGSWPPTPTTLRPGGSR